MVMKLTTTNIVVIMSALIVLSAGTTFAFTQGLVDNNSRPSGALFTGNVKATQYDGDGNIIAYRQSDNHIVAEGMELIMINMFSDINASSAGWEAPPTGADSKVRWMVNGTYCSTILTSEIMLALHVYVKTQELSTFHLTDHL